MKRRDFIKTGAVLGAVSLTGFGVNTVAGPVRPVTEFPRYRGFNLLAKFSGRDPGRKFNEEDFEIMADWGFDFARIPMSYWNWASKDDWYAIDEEVLKDIDEVIEYGRQYNIHINLN
ncbi:MAG: cellulase family glycosylhydrolase, partial [Bacteroidales bacterium]